MENSDFIHFERLKKEIEHEFLQENMPSEPSISKWKGIDIIYFQEDLRRKAKGNISEKSFYTYFKSQNINKLPRIDMLNILSIYAGYDSWHAFKKKKNIQEEESTHNISGMPPIPILEEEQQEEAKENSDAVMVEVKNLDFETAISNEPEDEKSNLQNNTIDNKQLTESPKPENKHQNKNKFPLIFTKYWAVILGTIVIIGVLLGVFWKDLFGVTYIYSFRDADRSTGVNIPLNIKVIKENESPIYYRIEPGQDFVYSTKEDILKMEVTSPLYENLSITRNLNKSSDKEIITLRPDDYKTSVYYYSKKGIPGDSEQALEQIKLKRRELEQRISNQAVIYQVFDNNIYGIETLDKEKYITLVTTPTTSLKNLSFLDVKTEEGKIILIKFKIKEDE